MSINALFIPCAFTAAGNPSKILSNYTRAKLVFELATSSSTVPHRHPPPLVPAPALQQTDKGSVPPGSVAQAWRRAVRHEPRKGEVCPFSTGQEMPPRSGFSFAASPPEVCDLFNAAFFTACHNDGTDRGVIPKRRKGKKKKKKKKKVTHDCLPVAILIMESPPG